MGPEDNHVGFNSSAGWGGERRGESRALPLGKFSLTPEALTPAFHKIHRSERRLKPSLTSNCLFYLRSGGNYVGRAAAQEAGDLGAGVYLVLLRC